VTIDPQQPEAHLSVVIAIKDQAGPGLHDLLTTVLQLGVFLSNRIGWLAEQEVSCQQDEKLSHGLIF
jgi:hypothetical protein